MSGENNNARQVNKVIGREYLYRQFVAYNNINKLNLKDLLRRIVRLSLKVDEIQTVLSQNNIDVDFTDIDSLTDAEIDEMMVGTVNVEIVLPDPPITITGNNTVDVGDTITLTADENGVTWSSSNDLIATVTQAGVVEGLDEGTVVITASKSGFTAGTFEVTVQASQQQN